MKISQEIISAVVQITEKAGERILEVYNSDFEVEYKSDNSPLTQADLMANQTIVEGLASVSDLPILSEELSEIDVKERQSWSAYWLVDPLDGTKEFVNRNGEFTVNIALIENNKPIFGVIGIPVKKDVYYGVIGTGAFLKRRGKIQVLNPDQTPGRMDRMQKGILAVAASRSHPTPEVQDYIQSKKNDFSEITSISVGSSLKFCLLAEGLIDEYPRLGPTKEWDIAAGHAIVKSVNKQVLNYKTGEEMSYNKPNLLNDWFIVK